VQNWVQKWAINVLDLELNLNVVSMRWVHTYMYT
jgi:hypothetical protein